MSAAYPDVPGTPRATFLAELVGLRRSIVVVGCTRQGHDGGDDRIRAARDRPRPGVADRRARAAAREQRRSGRGLARGRGRRVRPLGLRAAGRDRRRDERRARPSQRVRVARRARGGVRALDGVGRRRRAGCAAFRRRPGRRRRTQPAERGCSARGTRAGGSAARRGGAGAGAVRGHRTAVRGLAGRRRSRSSTTTVIIRREVAATIATARELYPARRLRVLFQPHLYSRTRHLVVRARRRARGEPTTSWSRTSTPRARRRSRA